MSPHARFAMLAVLLALPALAEDGGAPDAGVFEPPRLVEEVPARFPPELDAGVTGEVSLQLTIDDAGEVSEARVLESTDDAFAREAVHAAVQLRFEPARLNGEPRAVVITFNYRFVPPVVVPSADAGTPAPQLVTLTGLVRSRGNRNPVPLARVVADDGHETLTGADGRFTLEVTPGARWVWVQASGFRHGTWREKLEGTLELEVQYLLTPERINPFEVVVRADRDRTELSRVELRDAEIREVPGTWGDPFRVIMLMPGVSAPVSGLSYPVVRGSGPASTGYFLDGVRVPQLFHVFLGPAVIHPDFLDGIDFYAGGAPVKYGRLVGGVIEGKLTRRSDDRTRFTAYADLLNAGGFVEVPFAKTDTRVAVAGRVSYTGLLLGAISPALIGQPDSRIVADFWDYQARVEQGFLGGKAQLFLFGSSDAFGTKTPAATSVQLVTFHRADAKYRHRLGPGELEGEFTFGSDLFGFESARLQNVEDPTMPPLMLTGTRSDDTRITQTSFITKATWRAELSEDWHVTAGGSWDHLRAGLFQSTSFTPTGGPTVSKVTDEPIAVGNFFGAWADATFTGVKGLSVTAGVRFDHLHLVPRIDQDSADPRISARYELTDTVAVRASAGIYHQPPTFLISLPVVDLAAVRFGLQEVAQTSVGMTWKLWRELELSADAYVNPMQRTLELGLFDDEQFDLEVPGRESGGEGLVPPAAQSRPGLAYGLDLMLRWPMKGHFFGWVTLSLQRSERYSDFKLYNQYGRVYGTDRDWLPYAFDQTLVANVVASYRFDNGWSLGTTLHFNTGRPESGQFNTRTRIPGVDANGRPAWIRVSRDRADRLPPFFRADVRVSKTWVFDSFTLEGWLDVLNVTVSSEVVDYDYRRDAAGNLTKTATSLPVILPSIGLKGRY